MMGGVVGMVKGMVGKEEEGEDDDELLKNGIDVLVLNLKNGICDVLSDEQIEQCEKTEILGDKDNPRCMYIFNLFLIINFFVFKLKLYGNIIFGNLYY